MPDFGKKSLVQYSTLCPELKEILTEAIKCPRFDFSIIEAWRSGEDQDVMYENDLSHARAGESPHNCVDEDGEPESRGVDLTPYPSGYKDGQAMLLLAGHIISTADRLGYDVTNGSDWDRDGMVIDTNFKDFWHFEMTHWRTA